MNKNITPHHFEITLSDRAKRLGQKPKLIWFTGLSGSGKSTLANELEKNLFDEGYFTFTLDGDNVRNGVCKDLSFSKEDRVENIRRIGEISYLFLNAGFIVIASFVSPYKADREKIKKIIGAKNYVEIYVSTSLEECEKRDVKGLYKKARLGIIKNFTGITSEYETPTNPDLTIDTEDISLESASKQILKFIKKII